MNRKDFRSVKIEDFSFDIKELRTKIMPLIQDNHIPDNNRLKEWGSRLEEECREQLINILHFSD